MWIVRECILEFKLTYYGERLFGETVLKSIIKSFRKTVKCFTVLMKTRNVDFENYF